MRAAQIGYKNAAALRSQNGCMLIGGGFQSTFNKRMLFSKSPTRTRAR